MNNSLKDTAPHPVISVSLFVSAEHLYNHHRIFALFLLGFILLGVDWGVAVLYGCDWEDQDTAYQETLFVPWMG